MGKSTSSTPGGIGRRFEVEGWSTERVDGRDHDAIERALITRHEDWPHVVVADMRVGSTRSEPLTSSGWPRRPCRARARRGDGRRRVRRLGAAAASTGAQRRDPRAVDIAVAGGLALRDAAGGRTYTPFLVERPFEQMKLDLRHQDVGAMLVDRRLVRLGVLGRTTCARGRGVLDRQPRLDDPCPGPSARVPAAAPRWRSDDDRVYLRLSDDSNHWAPVQGTKGSVGCTRELRAAAWSAVRASTYSGMMEAN